MAANDTIYCQKSSATETDWEKIYEVAFRPDQRTPLNQLQDGVRSGQMLLHRSYNKDGLLCFSVTNILPSIGLLAYLATDPNKQSSGIGSRHMKSLIAQVKADNPQLIGMLAEIESTREKGIDEDTKKHRKRRLAFYHRLGFKRYKSLYTIPSYEANVPDEEGELIWLEFKPGTIDCKKLLELIKEIYVKAYLLKEDDARVTGIKITSSHDGGCDLPVDDSHDHRGESKSGSVAGAPTIATSGKSDPKPDAVQSVNSALPAALTTTPDSISVAPSGTATPPTGVVPSAPPPPKTDSSAPTVNSK
ncbi:MAG: hypothetical protein K2X93_13100 [Candidatus Obscuribacterales bacterium]|nr:hypothetical protein [Candidatus Obscuribacterales bacterium]